MENRKSGLAFVALCCGVTFYSYNARIVNGFGYSGKFNFFIVIPLRMVNAISNVLWALHALHIYKLNACYMHSADGTTISS